MNYYALIKNAVVSNVVRMETAPVVDGFTVIDVTGIRVGPGWLYSNGVFTEVVPVEVTNEATLRQQAESVLTSNLQDIADADAWLNGVGAGTGVLTTAQLSPAVRQIMRALRASKKAENGAIRILLGRYESTA